MKVVLDHIEEAAQNIRTFWFKPQQQMQYTAGQYTQLTVPHEKPDERGIKHYFTLSSSPSDKMLSITTRFFGDKASTFKKTLWQLPMGTPLHMADAMGDFVLPKDVTIPLVFVAGGIGITPFHSMIKWLHQKGEKRDIHLIYGANQLEQVAFRPLFEAYGCRFQIILNEPPKHWEGEQGALSADKILELAGDTSGKTIYLSGPEPMIKTFEKDLLARGLERHRVVTDDFPGYSSI